MTFYHSFHLTSTCHKLKAFFFLVGGGVVSCHTNNKPMLTLHRCASEPPLSTALVFHENPRHQKGIATK